MGNPQGIVDVKETNPKAAVGVKKVSMSVVPATVLSEVALGMAEGALKYGRHNYRISGCRASVYYDGTMRHLMQWWEGEDIDPDSGLSHITKAISSLIVLRDCMMRGQVTDDRPPKSSYLLPALNLKMEALLEKYPEPKDAFCWDYGLPVAPSWNVPPPPPMPTQRSAPGLF